MTFESRQPLPTPTKSQYFVVLTCISNDYELEQVILRVQGFVLDDLVRDGRQFVDVSFHLWL